MNPTQLSMIELRDAIGAKQVSAAEAVDAYLARIDAHNGPLNAYHEVFADEARQRAAQVDDGQVTGPLAGVPIAVKDVFCTTQGTSTASSKMLAGYRSPFTATSIARLEAAGAIILGKTNMDEFAMGSSCEHCVAGKVLNPWDTSRTPGGSSGGGAAAMAADLCSASIGTDTGGSIRQPAALCGIVGLKPTYGRVSRWGMIAFASSLDQAGPLCRTVDDAALLLKVMGGPDPLDATCSRDTPTDDLDAIPDRPRRLRIGLAKQYVIEGANDPAVQKATDDAIALYRSLGAEIVDVDLPHTEYGIPVYYIVAPAEASSNLARFDGVHYGHRTKEAEDLVDLYFRSREEGFGDEVKRRIMLGAYALSSGYYDAYYNRALKVRRLIKQDFDQAFEQCDVILSPTTTGPAFRLGEKLDDPLAMYLNDVYTVNVNLAGICGVSVPAGVTEVDGKSLPVGIQLIGPAFGERTLLQVARMYEREAGHAPLRPALD